ncbi:hypothetical protein EDB80DRAFT_875629 [Ilyonectria destructans]|nr:hypothetical protein EDB80DRAFT_875629 [Ilyonectria destructans]
MAPSMALQISRFTNASSEILLGFEEKLTENLATRIRYFKSLSEVCLFSIATGNRVPSNNRDLDSAIRVGQQEGGIENIAARIAHVGVVHWWIRARMAYVDEDDASMD